MLKEHAVKKSRYSETARVAGEWHPLSALVSRRGVGEDQWRVALSFACALLGIHQLQPQRPDLGDRSFRRKAEN